LWRQRILGPVSGGFGGCVWRALSLENPQSIRLATTHPTTPVRYLQMRKVFEEIADKKRRNLPLLPELKIAQVHAEPAPAAENNN
jgi:hypothetical protein